MGRTHATSGALAFLAVLPLLSQAGLSLTPLTLPVAALAAAGAATLPDLDHPQATVSRSFGPVTVGLARRVSWCTGGHRGGTHSLVAVAALSGGAAGLDLTGALPRGLACAFLFALATAAVQLRLARPLLHTTICVAAAIGLVTLSAQHPVTPGVLPCAVGVGSAAHLVGDMLTAEGVPLLWPVSRRRFRIASLKTGGTIEQLLVGPGLALSALVLGWQMYGSTALYSGPHP
jgi:membrane-bound metal-dependent hydrolase YbcI (DUF457 family)